MKQANFTLKTSDWIKEAIKNHLFRYGSEKNGLTAKEIQERLGLKRQTTYNYLKELVENEEIETDEQFLETNPNVKTVVYKYKRKNPNPIKYKFRLMDIIKEKDAQKIREELNRQIKMSLASLIETLGHVNSLNDEELLNYALESEIGPAIDNILLRDSEFKELKIMFEEFEKLWEKWGKVESKEENKHLLILGGFKSIIK